MSMALLGRDRFFEWDRFVGTHMTPVDAVQNAQNANQSIREYAQEFARNNPSDDIETEDLVDGMVADMTRAAHNLANFRVTGNSVLSPHSETIFSQVPEDPVDYYLWVARADPQEIVDKVTSSKSAASE